MATRPPRQQLDEDLRQAGKYATVWDLVAALGGGRAGVDRLIDAYVQGWLNDEHTRALEERSAQLTCWLLARLVRLALPQAVVPK